MKIFISHQWTDKQIADRLARDLEPFGDVWIDYRALRPGERIQPTIDAALEGVDLVLLVWTSNAARSSGVAAEIATCLRLGLRLVPCFFEYDERGNATPPLPDELRDVLGVDFHHYGSALAQIANLLVELQGERLPENARPTEHPGRRMLDYLRGYLSYLANYRTLRGVPDERGVWIDRIITEIERYLASGGNAETVRALVEAAKRSEAEDPEGIGALVTRLEAALAAVEGAPSTRDRIGTDLTPSPIRAEDSVSPGAVGAGGFAGASPGAGAAASTRRRAGVADLPRDSDELARRVAAFVPAEQVRVTLEALELYLASAPTALEAMRAYALEARSPAGVAVVDQLHAYFDEPDDLLSDDRGRFGRLDDAWLILNTAFRLIESGLLPVEAVPIQWPTVIATDHIVRQLIPPDVLEALTGMLFRMLQLIQAEVATYQPWFTPAGSGYAPHIAAPRSGGGTWEDEMNRALLGTGLSVD